MSLRNNSLSMRSKNMAITAHNPSTSSKGPSTGNGKGISCSTPEPHRATTSPCDSDSDAASPVPFLCTQDGSYGDTEVVWNYYTPRADRGEPRSRNAQATPLSRKTKKVKPKNKIGELQQPRRRPGRASQKKSEKQLYEDLLELNKNIQGFLERAQSKPDDAADVQDQSGSEDDIFNISGDRSPKPDGFARSRCLRRNLLSSKFSKQEPEAALESDDSMNECLMRASQMIEEKVFCSKRNGGEGGGDASVKKCKIEQDSIDAVLNNIKLESPLVNVRRNSSLINDSFDNCVGNMNDSALEKLTQLPIINDSPRQSCATNRGRSIGCVKVKIEPSASPTYTHTSNSSGWTIKELIALDSGPSLKSSFGRHSSMPESPSTIHAPVRPSSSGTALSRHSSMPGHGEQPAESSSDDSTPMRCTPEEIKKKHQQAREKLLAKRLFPNSSTQQSQANSDRELPNLQSQRAASKFQPKFPLRHTVSQQNIQITSLPSPKNEKSTVQRTENAAVTHVSDLKSIIEKKRKEALLKLKMKRSQSNKP